MTSSVTAQDKVTTQRATGGFALIDSLQRHGVRHIFGYPGGAILPIYDELYKAEQRGGIGHILVRHEQGAAHAADGYARATGEVLASIPEPSVIYGPPHYLAFQVGRDRGLIAQITGSGEPDRAFLEQTLGAGYTVYMIEPWVLEMEQRGFGLVQDGPPVGTDTALPLYPVTLR